jgi:hypothetical protein
MAIVRAKDGVVTIVDATGTLRNITTFVDGVDDSFETEILDTTTYGAAYKSSTRGFIGWSGSIKGKWDGNGSLTPEQWFPPLITAAGSITSVLWYGPAGSAAGKPYALGTVHFANFSRSGAYDSIVTWAVDFELATGAFATGTL